MRTQFDKSEFALEAAFIDVESAFRESQADADFPDFESVYLVEFIQQTINHLNK